jgi:FKBP-type peptidyl-prolyl cis-trans isomerase FkpA
MKNFLVAVIMLFFLGSCSKDEVPLPYDEQLAKDVLSIDTYLIAKGIATIKDPTGFRYVVSAKGNDNLKPVLVDSIRASYSITLLGGNTVLTNSNIAFLLNKLIKPWKTILPLYGEGAKITLYVPSGLAYGNYPTGPIPANSNLIFEMQIARVVKEFSGQLQKDIAVIDEQLKSNINVVKDQSGVRYLIIVQGSATGLVPASADSVVVKYTGRTLSGGFVFDPQNSAGFRLSKPTTPKSWQKIFPLLKEGMKATLYVPSGLGYGAYGTNSGVPPYANLVYDVELVKVIKK